MSFGIRIGSGSQISLNNSTISDFIKRLVQTQSSSQNALVIDSRRTATSSSGTTSVSPPQAPTTQPAPPPPPAQNSQTAPPAAPVQNNQTLPPPPQPISRIELSKLPFNVSNMPPGEAYARIARLDNNELSITAREQLAATDLVNAGIYKETPVYGSNIVFLSNPSFPALNEEKALREINNMVQMPIFNELFKGLAATGQKTVLTVSNYGSSFAAGNVNLTDRNGKTINFITLDPNYIDYDHNNPSKRNIISALSNELHEILARSAESKQNANYVATRPFQEATLAVDELMENYIYNFSINNRVNYGSLSPEEKSRIVSTMQNWSPNLQVTNLQRSLDSANYTNGYAGLPPIYSLQTAKLAAEQLNNKLTYLFGANRKVEFVPSLNSNGTYTLIPSVVRSLAVA